MWNTKCEMCFCHRRRRCCRCCCRCAWLRWQNRIDSRRRQGGSASCGYLQPVAGPVSPSFGFHFHFHFVCLVYPHKVNMKIVCCASFQYLGILVLCLHHIIITFNLMIFCSHTQKPQNCFYTFVSLLSQLALTFILTLSSRRFVNFHLECRFVCVFISFYSQSSSHTYLSMLPCEKKIWIICLSEIRNSNVQRKILCVFCLKFDIVDGSG